MEAKDIIAKFGGQTALAALLGKGQTTVSYWAKTGVVPARWQPKLLELAEAKGIALSPADFMAGTTHIALPNKHLPAIQQVSGTGNAQGNLFHVEKQIEFQDVEMGVLESGVPYLTSRGLAKMIGIDHGPFHRLTANWDDERVKPRGRVIAQLLEEHGYFEPVLYLKAEYKGVEINAFTEPVCLALLEYYAFMADDKREKAINAFRALARVKFREFVYEAVGYDPDQRVLDSWKHFHDRVDLTADAVPFGYFGVFKEIAGMIVPMIRAGILISDRVVPDISVGRSWSEYWDNNNLSAQFGDRTKYDHEYPLYYPQSKSNPQPAYAYPNGALGAFRDWLMKTYITSKFPAYLLGQTKKGSVSLAIANKALGAFGANLLEDKGKKKLAAP